MTTTVAAVAYENKEGRLLLEVYGTLSAVRTGILDRVKRGWILKEICYTQVYGDEPWDAEFMPVQTTNSDSKEPLVAPEAP